jgi:polyhydroxyalkanoate synthesis regulator phasin
MGGITTAMARGSSAGRQGPASRDGRDEGSRGSSITKRAGAVGSGVGAIRDVVRRSVLAPVNAVMLTRRGIEEVVEDAVKRGRMTRDDAQQMVQSLLQYGAKQTDDFLADLEKLLARGSTLEERSPKRSRSRSRRPRARRATANLPIAGYDDLSAAEVQERLDGLKPAELRKLRDYERRHANRKTVLDRIERKLR